MRKNAQDRDKKGKQKVRNKERTKREELRKLQ